jgi:hypothetical protein
MALTEPHVANAPARASHIPQEALSLLVRLPTPRLDKVTAKTLLDF